MSEKLTEGLINRFLKPIKTVVKKKNIKHSIHPITDELKIIDSGLGKKRSVNLKRLGVYHSKSTEQLISPAMSRYSKEYYEDFDLTYIPPKRPFPFFLTIEKESINKIDHNLIENDLSEKGKTERQDNNKYRILIDYSVETDSYIIFNRLSDLDKQILYFIAVFRDVQLYQIVKETGKNIDQVKKSLERLTNYSLIAHYQFKRDTLIEGEEKGKKLGDSYSILTHGSVLLLKNNMISQEFVYKWLEEKKRVDSFTSIRNWKIVDAYLTLRLKDDFSCFVPYSYFKAFQYTEAIESIPQTTNDNRNLNKQSQEIVENLKKTTNSRKRVKKVTVPRVRFDGRVILKGTKDKYAHFNLFPFIPIEEEKNKEIGDLVRLKTIFRQFGHLKNGYDELGNHHLLVIIVDSFEQIKLIEDKYKLTNDFVSLKHILFFNLELSSTTDMLSCLQRLVINKDGKNEIRTMPFKLDEVFIDEKS
ncbi:TPA: hypothetical protein ACQ0F8_001812 [Streptococcus agalactiae]|nr:hypothetical protein [Streptococcus agalactiae]HEO4177377.1 hypothetical protein [Streptococcus agalactiae]